MPERRRLLLACAALAVAARRAAAQDLATAAPPEVLAELPGARPQGQGRLRFFGLHVYDMRLWTAARGVTADDWSMPLALEITYARALVGRQIAERSLDEMKRQTIVRPEQGERWLAAMSTLFPDVKAGDRLTGVQRPGEGARFFLNGALRGEVRDADFARLFFGIWLAPQTSEPRLRENLLGAAR